MSARRSKLFSISICRPWGRRVSGTIIAFDLASKTGVAVGSPGSLPLLLTERLGVAGTTQDARFSACMTLCNRLIRLHQPGEIVIEKPITGKKERDHVSFLLIGLRACVRAVAHLHGVPVNDHAVNSIRRHFIGQGNLSGAKAKPIVHQRCLQLGWKPDGPDAADAGALWDFACSMRSRSHQLSTQNDGLLVQRGGNENGELR